MSISQPSVTHVLAQALARHATHSFGLMGNGNAHLIEHLGNAGVKYTAVRHEAATVAAADAYTRVSGQIAIATTTYGAGFTNTLTALAEAAQAHTPMLVVVGDAPSSGPRPWDVDEDMLSAAVGVRLVSLSVTNVAETVDRAVAYALRVRKPIVLGIPYDLVNAPVESPTPQLNDIDLSDPAVLAELSASVASVPAASASPKVGSNTREPSSAPAHRVEAALEALRRAERPLLLAGHGAHLAGVSQELGALADALGAVTSTTALGRSIFPDSRYDLGVTGGFGQPAAMRVVEQADVVVVVGASLNQFTMRFGDLFGAGATVIRLDIEEVGAPKTNHPITHLLLQGDARMTLQALIAGVTPVDPGTGWRTTLSGLEPGGALRVRDAGTSELCDDGLLDPRQVAARLGELLPDNRHVTTDGGHFIGWANMFWPVASPERHIMVGTAYQTIGLGFCTVPGVAAAAPDSTVVLSTGDGGGLMALADLETAIRTAASQVIVVWNDSAYSAEVHLYGELGLDKGPMLIPDVNFAGVASALGAQSVVVRRLTDLDALESWKSDGARGTLVLDCRVSGSVVAEYQREIQRINGLDVPEV